MTMITEHMRAAMQGIIPSFIVTASADGVPNINYISQVYYVDEHSVAISHQFFSKSIRNLKENPNVCACIVNPTDARMWRLHLTHLRSETEGDLYDQMCAQLEGIATMMGMEDVFRLKAAEVFTLVDAELLT
jgi:predicted pyridoxine 5'-phosphate oxidase superfamily flavin-nucleotide-binding protein